MSSTATLNHDDAKAQEPGPLRILLISSSSGSAGGGEFYLVGLAQGLAAMGHEVHVAMSDHSRMDGLEAMLAPFGRVHRYPYRNTYDRAFRGIGAAIMSAPDRQTSQIIERVAPDIVHINKQNLEDGLDLIKAGESSGLPLVTTIHVTRSMASLGARLGRLRDAATLRCLRKSKSHWLAIAKACRDELQQYIFAGSYGAESVSLHCVNNGVSESPHGDRSEVRKQWGCHEGDIVLGCVARIEPQKNPLFVVDLLRRLPSNVRLIWIGDGRQRAALRSYAQAKGVTDRLHLDGWREDARRRMAGFDAFILPSIFEGFAFAVLEAMAAGLLCVASDVDGTREAIIDGRTGYLCPVNDLDIWGDRVGAITASATLRTQMGQAGRDRWREHFSLESMTKGTLDVYRKVIAQFKTTRAAHG